jgi:hypothetical protein
MSCSSASAAFTLAVGSFFSRICAASAGLKPSSAVSRKACRERGAMRISRSAAPRLSLSMPEPSPPSSSWAPVEHQMAWNTW